MSARCSFRDRMRITWERWQGSSMPRRLLVSFYQSNNREVIADKNTDQIARQVEDPGLRHTDKTQVGLELCTRHAAEFFGFYICRFVLTDISLLLDKFIKRGSEWVLV